MAKKMLRYFDGIEIITVIEGEDNVEMITHNEGNGWAVISQNNTRKTIVSSFIEFTENLPLYGQE